MKIIDLYNKITNGEEMPKKVKWGDFILVWDEEWKDYRFFDSFEHLLVQGISTSILNDEVEILEEEKKIPEKLNLGNATANEQLIEFKINEIIDYFKSKGE